MHLTMTDELREENFFLLDIKLHIASFLNRLDVSSHIIVINSVNLCSIIYSLNISMKQHPSQKKCKNPM